MAKRKDTNNANKDLPKNDTNNVESETAEEKATAVSEMLDDIDFNEDEEGKVEGKPKGSKANSANKKRTAPKHSAGPKDKNNKTNKSNESQENVDTDALMAQAAKQLEDAKAEALEWKASYQRVYAEWDTYRRRTEEQRKQDKATATEALVCDILPVLDDFERTIDYAEQNGETGLIDGVKAVHTKLVDSCKKSGMEVIDPQYGDAFDAIRHQAVQTVDDDEVYDESVHTVLQKGFSMGGKVLRPATVVITTGGKTRPKDEENEAGEQSNEQSEDEVPADEGK